MATKKLNTLPLKRKVELIEATENKPPGKKKKEIAEDFHIPPNTLSSILKNKDKYLDAFYGGTVNVDKKRQRPAQYEEVDKALLHWFSCVCSSNAPVNGPILMAKAESLAEGLGIEGWHCSAGWLDRFKKRHNIVFKSICGESMSVDPTVVNQWTTDVLPKLVQNYHPRDIFNADETGIFWRLLPDKTMAFRGETCSGGKRSKERITGLVCANSDGSEKLPLLIIGKFKKPRCFKGIKHLPTEYEANQKAWMTGEIFASWVRKFDQKMHRQQRKVLLLVDNCPAHPRVTNLKATNLVFLPPNTTAKLQPCDLGIIYNLKCHYRRVIMKILLSHIDAGGEMKEFSITLLEAMSTLRTAWQSVTQQTISNCFRKAGFATESTETEDQDDTPDELATLQENSIVASSLSFSDLVNVDSNLAVSGDVTDENDEDDEDNQDDDCGEPVDPVTSTSAFKAVATLRTFFMQKQCDADKCDRTLNGLQTLVEKCIADNAVQKNILHYFGPSS